MLDEIYTDIFEKTDFSASDKFETLIKKSISQAIIENDRRPDLLSISFKFGTLLPELNNFAASKGKDKTLKLGTETLMIITNALQFDLEESEAFLLFQLRQLGKFRKKESDLHNELKKLWKQYPEYEMEDRDFSRSLKNLMREKFIEYRRGNIKLTPAFIIRYKL